MNRMQPFEVPSPVLHIRSIPTGTTENDLLQITFDQSHKFGKCISVRLLERYHQALLEMDSIESATRLLKYSQKNSLLLHGKPVQISYSKSQSINQSNTSSPMHSPTPSYHPRVSSPTYTTTSSSAQQNVFPLTRSNTAGSPTSSNTTNSTSGTPIPGSVLLCTIENPSNHSITIDHLYHVFSSCGEVLRIVMFNKNNLQALIEFSSVDNALNAKKTLSGHALFHGGQCTLKLEISKTDRLNIPQNTDRAKDFTKSPTIQSPAAAAAASSSTTAASSTPTTATTSSASSTHYQPSYYQSHRNNNNNNNNNTYSNGGENYQSYQRSSNHHNSNYHHHHSYHNGHHHNRTTVLIVHGLDENIMTIDRIFNLFSVYGNVQRIKILSTKKGAALVQMEDPQQAEIIIRFYHQMPLFKDTLQITFSKHLSITDSHNPDSPTLSKNYTESSLHRFSHPINTYKHLYKPSQTLYFSNVPKDFSEASFTQLLQAHNLPKPIGFKIFSTQLLGSVNSPTSTTTPPTTTTTPTSPSSTTTATATPSTSVNSTGTPTTPSTSATTNGTQDKNADKIVGLLEFQNQTQAVEALVLLNNLVLPNSHYSLRLSFSNSTVLPHPPKVNPTPNSNNNSNTTTTTTTTTTNNNNNNTNNNNNNITTNSSPSNQQKHF